MGWVLIPWCTMMKFTSGCGADLPGSNRNKVDKFRINQKKTAPTYCAEETKQTNSEYIWKKHGEITKNTMKFQNSEGFHHVPDQCCHFPPKPMCFIMLFSNPAVSFRTLPFLSSFTMHFPNISSCFFQTLLYFSESCHSKPLSPCFCCTFHHDLSYLAIFH